MSPSLWQVFSAVSAAVPDRNAIWMHSRRISFGDLRERASRFADVLASRGFGAHRERAHLRDWECGQDTVALYLLNGPEFIEANLGGYAARAAPFNVNWRYVASELAYLLNDASAAVVVYHQRFAPTLAEALPRLKRKPLLIQVADGSGEALLPGALDYETALAVAEPTASLPTSSDDCFLLYSGGTTGMPKGVLWRQEDIWQGVLRDSDLPKHAAASAAASYAAGRTPERGLIGPPLIHGAGQWQALQGLLKGDSIAFLAKSDRLDPVDFWKTMEQARVSTSILVGEAFARPLLDEYEAGEYDASTLRAIVVGGAFTSQETKERFIAAFPDVLIYDSAGSSESGRLLRKVTTKSAKPGSFSLFDHSTVLNPEKTRRLEPGEEQDGWLAGSGYIPLGYLGDEQKTKATFVHVEGRRWSIPGDRARRLLDGAVELLGRESFVINTGGEKVFAEEVEQALIRQPGVADVVVVGRPSERWGQEVTAIISLQAGATPSDEEICAGAAATIARYKLPKAIVRVSRVERGPNGKVDIAWARAVAAGSSAARRSPPSQDELAGPSSPTVPAR
jgi:3-oxocholest-4-en-26-oate---CoA ligase